MLAKQWLDNARNVMSKIEDTQLDNIRKAAEVMADSIEAKRWVHTFGCGHATDVSRSEQSSPLKHT